MFEQTTPQSNCCLESLRVLFLGLSACLAEWSREMRGKVSQVCQKWSFLFFLYSCGHTLQWWVWSGSVIQLLSSCLITDWTWSCSEVDKNHIWLKVHMKLYIWWPQEQQCSKTPAASPSCSSTLTIFSSEVRSRPVRRRWRACSPTCSLPLCQTGAVTPSEATEAISTSNLTSVWSRHRNPLALKKLPPSLCLTSNGAFFSSLSFFMFVCKVLYITWIYYAHILPNG